MTKKKIVWKHHELLAVARRAYAIRNDPMFSGADVAAVRQAQEEVLPSHRQRPIRTMQEVPRIIHLFRDLRQLNYTEPQGAAQPIRSLQPTTTRAVTVDEESLMSEVMRRLVREEVSRVLESRERVSPTNEAGHQVPGWKPGRQWFKIY